MNIVRSILFNLCFYANLIIRMIVLSPIYFLMPRKAAYAIPKNWARSSVWLMEKIVGTTFEIEGLENIPAGGYILAPKHQSFWDTFALLPYLDDPVYILKRELMWIPLFGWYAGKQQMIPVDRGARGKVMLDVLKRTREVLAKGRQLIIYPEGTRRPPGAEPLYKYGIARMYRDLGVPVVPVAMHPGLFWPRRTLSALSRPFQSAHPAPHRSRHGSGCLLCAADCGNGKSKRRVAGRDVRPQSEPSGTADRGPAAGRDCCRQGRRGVGLIRRLGASVRSHPSPARANDPGCRAP